MFLCDNPAGVCATSGSHHLSYIKQPTAAQSCAEKLKGLPSMKKSIASLCLCFLATGAANAGVVEMRSAGPHRGRQDVLDQIMQAKDSTIPSEHSGAGNVRRRGPRDDQGRLCIWRTIWPGRCHMPYRPWMECAGVHSHGRRIMGLADRRPVHRPDSRGRE